MKRTYLFLLIVFASLSSCEIYKRFFSVVSNKFPDIKEINTGSFETWNKNNLYIMRVELKTENKVIYQGDNETITELSDYPLKDYKLVTHSDWYNENIVEEVYLYLEDFEKSVDSGSAVYMSSMPLKPNVSKLMFCNSYFISTYAINHVMIGKWKREKNNIDLILSDKNNKLNLVGELSEEDKEHMIEFTKVTHPKSMVKNDKTLIEIQDVFEVDPNDESDDENIITGIRFFQNLKRTFVHPNWSELGDRFDYDATAAYYSDNIEKRKITKILIGDNNDHLVFFEVNGNTQIGYRK
jgi:hypothetical protein